MTTVGRTLGIDLGSKRIGVAVSNAQEILASPLTMVERSGDTAMDHRRLMLIASDEAVVRLVVGLPVALDGTHGIAAQNVLAEVAQLRARVTVPVETFDERLTTAIAARGMYAQNLTARKQRKHVDKRAAAVMLQGWLDLRCQSAQ